MSDIYYPQAWDMQPGETEKSYNGFRIYLAMSAPRSYKRTADELGVSLDHIKAWGAKYKWTDRARKYDIWQMGQLDQAHIDALKLFQGQVVTEEIEDYQKMRQSWQDMFDNLLENVTEIDPAEYLDRMKKLAQVRTIIDQMARKAASLPNTYRAAETKQAEAKPSNEPRMLTFNGPRLLSEVRDDGSEEE